MNYRSFDELISSRPITETVKVAVVGAMERDTLQAICEAVNIGLVYPVLIGPAEVIRKNMLELGMDFKCDIIDGQTSAEWLEATRGQVNSGNVQMVMKDQIKTGDLMRLFVKKENGFLKEKVLSHLAFNKLPYYHKLLCLTDTSLNPYPSLETKKALIDNAVSVMRKMGFYEPKVAVLSAVEYANPKMPETMDALELRNYYMNQVERKCVVEGPISIDLSLDKRAAGIKHYDSPVAGDADILLAPNMVSGNLLGKAFNYTPGSEFAGFVCGACVPIVLTSRASSVQNKYLSIALASLVA